MSRSLTACPQCGLVLGHKTEHGVLHARAVSFVAAVDGALIVTLDCPQCGKSVTKRAAQLSLD